MEITTLMLFTSMSITGYGEIVDGQPSWAQREMHVYTNLVRVDPEAWSDEYPCSLSEFTSGERTSKAPLYYHEGLTSIAQLHSDDMDDGGFIAHESSDGTDFGTRVWPWYEGTSIAENVALGYADNWDAVFQGWMCSAGHRSNIMDGDLEDIGTGMTGRSYTQDFGAGANTAHVEVAMGIHLPETPSSEVQFLATYDDGQDPLGLWVETASDCFEMDPIAGAASRGAYSVDTDAESGCSSYRFTWTTASGTKGNLPATGAYVYGEDCPSWTEAEPSGCTVDEDSSNDDDQEEGEDDSSSGTADDNSTLGDGGSAGSDCPGGTSTCFQKDDAELEGDRGCSTTSASGSAPLLALTFGLLIGPIRRRA